jgi:hypothetical protein
VANEGIVVVGVQRNPGRDERGRQRHGHIVTVRPELIAGTAESLGHAPIVNNIGRTRTIESAGTAFLRDGEPIHYYAPRGR